MLDPTARKPLNLQLWYEDILVAELVDLFPHQGTWFAQYQQIVTPQKGPVSSRLCEFIKFCEEWHQRLAVGENPDPKEFDAYTDLIESPLWRVPCPDGSELYCDRAPIFVQGEVSWNHPEVKPSTELATFEIWKRLQNYEANG